MIMPYCSHERATQASVTQRHSRAWLESLREINEPQRIGEVAGADDM